MTDYILEEVTDMPDAWLGEDPVRPELNIEFRTSAGRKVYGLRYKEEGFKAFLCMAYTTDIPANTSELASLTSVSGTIAVPYSVWSYQRGAGREIIKQVLDLLRASGSAHRVITLSPPTLMARKFHLRNNATELRINDETVNFEYTI